jgi:hypothetical protein
LLGSKVLLNNIRKILSSAQVKSASLTKSASRYFENSKKVDKKRKIVTKRCCPSIIIHSSFSRLKIICPIKKTSSSSSISRFSIKLAIVEVNFSH